MRSESGGSPIGGEGLEGLFIGTPIKPKFGIPKLLLPTCDASTGEDLVGARGFEPRTPCAQGRCATRLRYAPTYSTQLILKHASFYDHSHPFIKPNLICENFCMF
jgi:hypothetical protein